MNIKYIEKEGKAQLVVFEDDLHKAFKMEEKLWIFIYGHKHFVLRPYYRECKKAAVRRPQHPDELEEAEKEVKEGFTILIFDSSWEDHQPYVSILQKELKLDIEDLPK
jgi:hypothetical protein